MPPPGGAGWLRAGCCRARRILPFPREERDVPTARCWAGGGGGVRRSRGCERGEAAARGRRSSRARLARRSLARSLPPSVPPAGLSLRPRRRGARARRLQPLPPPAGSDRPAAPQHDARPLAAEEGVTARSGPAAAGRRSGATYLRSRGWAAGRSGGARRPAASRLTPGARCQRRCCGSLCLLAKMRRCPSHCRREC